VFLFPLYCTGAPIVVSFPHFYQADERYINAIEGMNPNEEEHETYLDINPVRSVDALRFSLLQQQHRSVSTLVVCNVKVV